jgi:hypothetical protein
MKLGVWGIFSLPAVRISFSRIICSIRLHRYVILESNWVVKAAIKILTHWTAADWFHVEQYFAAQPVATLHSVEE